MKIYTCNKSAKTEYEAIKVEVLGETIKFSQYHDRQHVDIVQNEDGTTTRTPVPFSIETTPAEDIVVSVFDLNEAKNLSQLDSGCSWNFYLSTGINMVKAWYVNAHAVTSPVRGNATDAFHLGKKEIPFAVIAMPRRDAMLADCFIGLNIGGITECRILKDGALVATVPLEDGKDLSEVRNLGMPSVTLAAPQVSAEGVVEVVATVALEDGSVDTLFNDPLYFETTGGYLSMTKSSAVAGVAKTKLRASDLVSGDKISVKVGTKFYTSLAKIDITVAA